MKLTLNKPIQTKRGRMWSVNGFVDVPGWNGDMDCRLVEVFHEETGRRLVACWNACEGLTTEELESRSLQARGGWISVEERLPGNEEKVLMFGKFGFNREPILVIGHYEPARRWWRPEGSNGDFSDMTTHWQPLPPSPNSGQTGAGGDEKD